MSTKSLKDFDPGKVEFNYRGKDYEAQVVGSFMLKDLSVEEIKRKLNEIPADYAYWKNFQVTLEREIVDLEDEFEMWFQEAYMSVDDTYAKKTEAWKKSRVALDNPEKYRKWRKVIKDAKDVAKKVAVLTSGYNNVIWTLREIARLTGSEISGLNASVMGPKRGSLKDL